MDVEPIAARHDAVIDRLTDAARRDERITGAWLQGSRADGSEDLFSDIDFYVSVADEHFDAFDKLAFISQAASVLVYAEPFPILAACLLEGPAKLDFFTERDSRIGDAKRPAVRILLDKTDVALRIKGGWEPDAASLARQVDTMLRATFQGGMWPVRLLRREQWATYAFTEMSIIVGTIMPLMLIERDTRAFARNSISRERLLTAEERLEIDALSDGVVRACAERSAAGAYEAHLAIVETLGRVGRSASATYRLEYPAAAEAEVLRFFEREWPRPSGPRPGPR
jgi:predicted nucleotidyltransferase